MNKNEFIKKAVRSGYATKKRAEEWVKKQGRDLFTDKDFEKVYRETQTRNPEGFRGLGGGRSTKRYRPIATEAEEYFYN